VCDCIVSSGIGDSRSNGIKAGSWYDRLSVDNAPIIDQDFANDAVGDAVATVRVTTFTLPLFMPTPLPVAAVAPAFTNDAIEEGVALHALMERLTHRGVWPLIIPSSEVVARWLGCTEIQAEVACRQAASLADNPVLERFFNRQQFIHARNEMTIVAAGKVLRCDRVVVFDDSVWVLDYKRNYLPSEELAYRTQLAQYRFALKAIYPNKKIQSALITADGQLLEIETIE